MSIQDQAGNVLLATAGGSGLMNFLAQADLIISILVGCLSAVGIIYSVLWHRVRIKSAGRKRDRSDTSE